MGGDRRDERFYEERENLVAEGSSPDGRVRVSVRAMRDWTVRIAPGAIDEMREQELAHAAAQAGQALIQDQIDKTRDLKLSIYEDDI